MTRLQPFTLGSLGAALLLSACATAPEPAPEPMPVQQPAPVMDAPEPAPQAVTPPPQVIPPVVQGPTPGSIEDFVFQSGGDARVYFAYDQHDLSPQARATLRQQADWLKAYPNYTAIIEGHADERGTRQYNIALGAERADSVRDFLVSQGISPSRLTSVSYGKERPIDPRSNEEGWARNRNGHTNLRPLGRG